MATDFTALAWCAAAVREIRGGASHFVHRQCHCRAFGGLRDPQHRGHALLAMATTAGPDWSEIDEGWDDIEPDGNEPETLTSSAPPPAAEEKRAAPAVASPAIAVTPPVVVPPVAKPIPAAPPVASAPVAMPVSRPIAVTPVTITPAAKPIAASTPIATSGVAAPAATAKPIATPATKAIFTAPATKPIASTQSTKAIAITPATAKPVTAKPIVAMSAASSAKMTPIAKPAPTRDKRAFKSKEERATRAERKAVKQAARRAERRATGAQNQKRPTVKSAAPRARDAAPLADTRSESGSKAPSKNIAMRTAPSLLLRRSLVGVAVVACLLLLGGLAWFLGWRSGGTMSLQ
jgi:hypothetical protein